MESKPNNRKMAYLTMGTEPFPFLILNIYTITDKLKMKDKETIKGEVEKI